MRAKVGDGELTVVGCSPERPGTQGKSCRHAGARLERESSWGRLEGRDPSDPSVEEDNGADSQHFRADLKEKLCIRTCNDSRGTFRGYNCNLQMQLNYFTI